MAKIEHAPKFYVRLRKGTPCKLPEDFTVFPGSVYGRYARSGDKSNYVFWVCDCYQLINGKLPVHIYNNGNWKLELCTPTHPCYKYVQSVLLSLGKVPKVESDYMSFSTVQNLMKHDRKRKCGSGGVRLTPFCGQVTDYECAKNPLHDFRRVWN